MRKHAGPSTCPSSSPRSASRRAPGDPSRFSIDSAAIPGGRRSDVAMKMPGGDAAIVDREKLTGYCLNLEHPRSKHKARGLRGNARLHHRKCRRPASRAPDSRRHGRCARFDIGPLRHSLYIRVRECRATRHGNRQEQLDRAPGRERSALDQLLREVGNVDGNHTTSVGCRGPAVGCPFARALARTGRHRRGSPGRCLRGRILRRRREDLCRARVSARAAARTSPSSAASGIAATLVLSSS